MNRSILIVLCDFLLVSLLAFSTVDINKVAHPGAPMTMASNAPEKRVTGRQDLGDVMRLALDEERRNRDQLVSELSQARNLAGQENRQIQTIQGQLQSKEELAARLQAAQNDLQRQFTAAQTNIETLNRQLHATTLESVLSKEQRAAMEAEARKQTEKASTLEHHLSQMQSSNQLMTAEQEALRNQLALSETAKRSAIAQMAQLQDEVEAQRRENAKLSEGVKALAAKSSELAQEIRVSRPMSPNQVFDELITNRVVASFSGLKSGLFGMVAADPNYNWNLTDIARATSAAPTFFPPLHLVRGNEDYALIDGGVFVNNPAMAAYAEARSLYPGTEQIIVVSVGTGDRQDQITYASAKDWGLLGWARQIAPVLMDSVSEAVDYELHALPGCTYYRLQVPHLQEASSDMDDVTPENLANLQTVASDYVSLSSDLLDTICTKLKQGRGANMPGTGPKD